MLPSRSTLPEWAPLRRCTAACGSTTVTSSKGSTGVEFNRGDFGKGPGGDGCVYRSVSEDRSKGGSVFNGDLETDVVKGADICVPNMIKLRGMGTKAAAVAWTAGGDGASSTGGTGAECDEKG